jgi:TolB protein
MRLHILKHFHAYLVVALLITAVPGQTQTDVYLEIYAKTFQRLSIELFPFTTEQPGAAARQNAALIRDVLSNDLWMSGYFRVDVKEYVSESSNGSGAIARINGSFRLTGDNLTITAHVLDNASNRTILRQSYTDRNANRRAIVHRIADDIVYSLTGEQGIAGSRIAFVQQKSSSVKEISVMDYDGHNIRQLTTDNSINISPAWSPDGSRVCYTTFQNNNPDLYLYNVNTGLKIKLSDVQGLNSAPAWSPDGKQIALTLSSDANAEIYLMDVERRKSRRITYNQAIDSSPSWSPSNRELAFTSDRTGQPQVYIMDTDGMNVRRLTWEGTYNDSPAWSPRGDRIAYVSRTDSGFDIYTIDVTGRNRMRLTDSSGANENPHWSPNGYSLVFSSNRSGPRALYSMFWDGTDQKKLTSGSESYSPAWSSR